MSWKTHSISTPLIHLYLQRAWNLSPNWRRLGARSNIETTEQFAKRSLLLLQDHIDRRAEIEAKDPNNRNATPIIIAARNGDLSILNLLISRGADVNSADDSGFTALHAACISTKTEIFVRLLESGAKANAVTKDRMSPLHFLCCTISLDKHGEVLEIIRLLLGHGADPTLRLNRTSPFFKQAHCALEASLSRLDIDISRLLLARSNKLYNKSDIWTFFRAMLRSPGTRNLRLLIEADRQKFILQDEEFLHHLLRGKKRRNHLVWILLDSGIAFNGTPRKDGANAVFWAVKRQKGAKLLERLLKCGISPNITVDIGKSKLYPLIEAIKIKDQNRRREYVSLLVRYGANFALLPDPRPLCTDITGHQPWRELESVTNILFSPHALRQVSKARQIELMTEMFQLPGMKILQTLLTHSSPDIVQMFAAQYVDALPIWILDAGGYRYKTKLTIEHVDLAIWTLNIQRHGAKWESEDLSQRRAHARILKQLMYPPRTETICVGAAWCLKRRIDIIGANGISPKIRVAGPRFSPIFSKETKLYKVGKSLRRGS